VVSLVMRKSLDLLHRSFAPIFEVQFSEAYPYGESSTMHAYEFPVGILLRYKLG
jgi:hypothetical protein